MGGALLSHLITSEYLAQKFDITVLVRSREKARRLESEHDIKVSIGALEDTDKVEQLAEKAHAVWSLVRAFGVQISYILIMFMAKLGELG